LAQAASKERTRSARVTAAFGPEISGKRRWAVNYIVIAPRNLGREAKM
jgi:hypothetical protein